MKTILFSFPLLVLLSLHSCNPSKTESAGSGGQQAQTINQKVDVEAFATLVVNHPEVQLIDVRTADEYAQGHLANAKNIDYNGNDFAEKIKSLDKTKPVYVYCLSGGRSSSAADQLAEAGFQQVYNLEGGIMKWRNAGKPVVTDQALPEVKSTGLTAADFKKITESKQYVLVDFNATWCGPCRAIAPMLESVAEKRKDKLLLVKIDVDRNQELAGAKGIASIPYLELYKDGKLVWKRVGALDEATLLQETGL